MFEISVRMVNLRAAFRSDESIDSQFVHEKALELDRDLQVWKAGVPLGWIYTTIRAPNATVGRCFSGKSHMYPTLQIADGWNYWRTLRILVNQIIVQNVARLTPPDTNQRSIAISIIRQLSSDICISTASYVNTPRTFIWLPRD
jgi:hypothetical protein